MTEAQKEYIITEEQMEDLHAMLHIHFEQQGVEILQCVTARPYKSDAVLEVGIDYILQKLEQEYDDGGYNPDIPLWIQVRNDLRKLRQQKER